MDGFDFDPADVERTAIGLPYYRFDWESFVLDVDNAIFWLEVALDEISEGELTDAEESLDCFRWSVELAMSEPSMVLVW